MISFPYITKASRKAVGLEHLPRGLRSRKNIPLTHAPTMIEKRTKSPQKMNKKTYNAVLCNFSGVVSKYPDILKPVSKQIYVNPMKKRKDMME